MADQGITIPPHDEQGRQFPPNSVISTGDTLTHATTTITAATPPEDALPDNFNPFLHLQEVYLPQHNAAVRLFFSDLPNDWKPNIATARSSLRVACTMLAGENELMTAMRHRLFYDLLGYGNSNLIVYNGSTNDIAPPVAGHPKVYLYFSQDVAGVPHGTTRLDAEYSFRLVKETAATYTKAKATALATLIKEFFLVSGQGIQFTKGKNIYRYSDPVNGYRLMIYANQETDALPVIQKMLECTETVYDQNKLTTHEPLRDNTVTPTEQLVYEKEIIPPKFRPIANVRFRYAYLEIPLVKKPIYLVDTTSKHIPLVH
ncbi:hypothetical protein [uncultured Nostoc sp.]|uniref:hypothetical protein n=1 Tax=uncultured Nostoc sp. TaxID=340711 RepID=UPI0035CBC017